MKKRLLALLLACTLVLALAGCGASSSSPPSEQPSAEPSQSASVDLSQDLLTYSAGVTGDKTLLTVGDRQVPADLFLYWLAIRCAYFQNYYGTDVSLLELYADSLLEECVSMASYYMVMERKSVALGCPLTDDQLATVENELLADGEEMHEARKTLYALSEDTIRFIYSARYLYANLQDALVAEPTLDDLNSFFYQTKHILLSTVDMTGTPTLQEDGSYAYPSLDADTVAQKKQLADNLLAQLRASDDPYTLFDTLMNEHSEDGRDAEGNLSAPDGYTATPGDMVPEYEAAALALKAGEISDIVESPYGYHIILRQEVEDIESYTTSYRDLKMDSLVASWLSEVEITRDEVLSTLDVVDFYTRYCAWQSAMVEVLYPEK